MNRFRLALLLLILTVGAALYFYQPWKQRRQAVDFSSAGQAVQAAQDRTKDVENYKYTSDVTVGSTVKVAVTDRVIRDEPRRQMVDFTWDIPKMPGSASIYAAGKELYIFHPLKNRWILPGEEPTIAPFLDYFWRELDLVDPVENLMKLDAGGKNLSLVKSGGQEDGDSAVIQVIPTGGALAEIRKSLPPQFAGAQLVDVKQFFRVSRRDLLVTRYEVKAKVAFFGIKTMDFLAVTEVADYDTTKIEIPKALEEKMKQGK